MTPVPVPVVNEVRLEDLSEAHQARITVSEQGCWIWTGSLQGGGYASVWNKARKKRQNGHRAIWEMHVGPIDQRLELDHLCRVRACVNPAHMEPVTPRVNKLRGNGVAGLNARKTHCSKGHPLSGDNLLVMRDGARRCRICRDACNREKNVKIGGNRVTKIKAGHYVHECGVHIVYTDRKYQGNGPAGGDVRGWEYASVRDDGELIIEGWAGESLRDAARFLTARMVEEGGEGS